MDAKIVVGKAIRQIRETLRLSQEKLAEGAAISYQYLSALENGKENFTIGILESLAKALKMDVPSLVARAYTGDVPVSANPDYFIKKATLPSGLTAAHVEKAMNETQRIIRLINTTLIQVTGRPLCQYIQSNNFSGIVSNILCDSFSRLTPYKHNDHQKYPDLIHSTPKGKVGLEVKATIKAGKGGESHNGHSGWHLVACFSLNELTGDVEFVHIMFAELVGHGEDGSDWKYVKSQKNETTGSQRTETYVTTSSGTAKLRHGTVYLNPQKVDYSRWRIDKSIKPPPHSLFQFRKEAEKRPSRGVRSRDKKS